MYPWFSQVRIQMQLKWESFDQTTFGKLRAHLSVFYVTLQADPQFSLKLLNSYIILALLSMDGIPY